MNIEEVIDQLESIRAHCESMIDKEDPNNIWRKDVIALDVAIAKLKKGLKAPQL